LPSAIPRFGTFNMLYLLILLILYQPVFAAHYDPLGKIVGSVRISFFLAYCPLLQFHFFIN
jgi:hypothetical protein